MTFHRIFPNFDADENEPSSYIFEPTDIYLQTTQEAGTETFYRLGASIEHGMKKGTYPPKDFYKWARVCEHIIRHYTEGWANGFNMKIEYWEIWNEFDCKEPNGEKPCWQGPDEQFHDFYEVVAKHLKSTFPHLKIGGPAITSPWSVADAFLAEMQKRNTPIDFYSFHRYSASIKDLIETVERAKEQIEKYGYEKSELHLNEWNYVRDWSDFKHHTEVIKGMKGASFVASGMSALQKTSLDMLMYYEGRPCLWCGLFDAATLAPLKTYYVFKAFDEVKKLKDCVLSIDDEDVYSIASTDGEDCAVMISRYSDEELKKEKVVVKIDNAPKGSKVEFYLLDEKNDLALKKEKKVNSSRFTLKMNMENDTVYLIKIIKR